MIQRLTLLLAGFVAIMAAPTCFALGLGDLELKSALNQQFYAEIELTNVRGLAAEEILPNLGAQKDFDRAGVERSYVLIDLRFKVEARENGQLFVRITSSKPIIEPFLDFIVEVLWPSGRMLREYTVLLDPPVFGKGGVEPIQVSPSQQRATAPKLTVPAEPQPPRQAQARETTTQSTKAPKAKFTSGEYGMTSYGDTLWKIALSVRPDNSVSVQQTMLALKEANPEAFINDNINLLKAGYVLRIPTERELRASSFEAAVAEVRIQNEEFEAYRSGTSLAQLDASRRRLPSEPPGGTPDEGELKLLAPDQSSGERAGAGGNARMQELENELAVTEEDLGSARRANTDLNVRFDDLEDQLETLNEILVLKDDQLAALRAEVTRMQSGADGVDSANKVPPPLVEPGASLRGLVTQEVLSLR